MIFGIILGLAAATMQSLSYFAMRHYVQRRGAKASWQLLVLGHVWMGVFALAQLAMIWPREAIGWGGLFWPLVGTTIFNIGGQLGLALALKYAEASRVSPLMASKLILTGVIAGVFGQPVGAVSGGITVMQWVGVFLCLMAGLSINFSGGRMRWKAVAGVALSAGSFAVSDWMINLTIKAFMRPGIDHARASLLTESFSYIVLGVIAVICLKPLGTKVRKDWVDAAPFAVTWFVAMIFLFIAFSTVGLLLASILQSTRGFITILLAGVLMYWGHEHIEPAQKRGVMVRRLGAGLVMFAGITLYVLRDGERITALFH